MHELYFPSRPLLKNTFRVSLSFFLILLSLFTLYSFNSGTAETAGIENEIEHIEEAQEITKKCSFSAKSARTKFRYVYDNKYTTCWRSSSGSGAMFTVTLPAGTAASGVWIQWYEHPHSAAVYLPEGKDWIEYSHSDGTYLSDYFPLPEGVSSFRIANPKGISTRMAIAELHIYGPGSTPSKAQIWNPPAEKADLMLLAAHPDDEILWFGGMLPTYAGQQGKTCQVCMMVPSVPRRRLEFLDCLWTCGVRNYPVWGKYPDSFSSTLKKQYIHWNKNGVYKLVTGWIRRFKPDVLVTHDINGEYGHGAHRVCADAVIHCLSTASNEEKYTESAKEYGVWDVPKCYLHLYPENMIDMDWRQPLSAFGGKTSFEIAQEAFRCHISQQKSRYSVEDSGQGDCSLFGLYRSLVGSDIQKNDLFENIE